MDLYRKIKKFNKENKLIRNGDKIVIGFSGGPDSVFMVSMLKLLQKEINFEMILVHINHMLRGKDADHDEEFSKNFALINNYKFYSKKIDILNLAKENNISSEEAGRKVRYDFFKDIMKKEKASKIALAHNKDDSIETFLFRLFRGTGLTGLNGILTKRDNYIRPINEIYKKDIIKYLDENNIKYCIDKTNFENIYTRNIIRNEIIPEIENRFNPKFKDKLFSLIEEINDTNEFLDNEINLLSKNDYIDIKDLKNMPKSIVGRVLARFLYKYNVSLNRKKINSIIDILDSDGNISINLGKNLQLIKNYDIIKVSKVKKKDNLKEKILKIPGSLTFGDYIIEASITNHFEKNKNVFCSNLKKDSLVIVRTRHAGDKIMPVGMKNYKKIKDIMINDKINIQDRDRIPILTCDDEVIWIAGIRGSQKYINKENKNFVKFTLRRKK